MYAFSAGGNVEGGASGGMGRLAAGSVCGIMGEMVTYRDIAKRTGFSATTVSLAWRGYPSITEQTREKVLTAARELGYRPNPLVAALMSSLRSKRRKSVEAILAIISPSAKVDRAKVHPGTRQVHELAAQHAKDCGYQTEELVLDRIEEQHKDLDRILHARRVTGLLLDDAGGLTKRLKLDWSRYSVVRIGSRQPPLVFHTVTVDHSAVVRMAIEGVLARGYTRVGLVLPKWIQDVSDGQFAAAWVVARELQGERRLRSVHACEVLKEGPFLDWVRRDGIDAVITPDHNVLMWLREAGLRVPEDVGVAHTDTTHPWWPFSGVEQDRDTMVRFAVELLISECNHNHRGCPDHPVRTSALGIWRDGETLRPPGG